eukprot:6190918-Pleurochrysis_carterae.AAC.3
MHCVRECNHEAFWHTWLRVLEYVFAPHSLDSKSVEQNCPVAYCCVPCKRVCWRYSAQLLIQTHADAMSVRLTG